MPTDRFRRREFLIALALSPLGRDALAQANFPDKPIRLVVPYPPGGAASAQLTLIQQKVLKNTGANLILDYKPGASGNIGVDTVLKSRPDGYTIGWAGTGSFAIIPHLLSKLPYDVSKDVQFITAVGSIANVVVASPSFAANDLRELVALSKKEDLSYALASLGSTMHLAMEAIIAETGLKIRSVPYKGEQPALLDVIPGRVPLMIITLPGALEYIRSGRLKALAVTSAARSPLLPNVSTLAEQGFKDLDIRGNFVFFGPTGIPPNTLQWLQHELASAIDSPEVKGALADLGTDARSMSIANTTAMVRAEDRRWGALVKKVGIKWD